MKLSHIPEKPPPLPNGYVPVPPESTKRPGSLVFRGLCHLIEYACLFTGFGCFLTSRFDVATAALALAIYSHLQQAKETKL